MLVATVFSSPTILESPSNVINTSEVVSIIAVLGSFWIVFSKRGKKVGVSMVLWVAQLAIHTSAAAWTAVSGSSSRGRTFSRANEHSSPTLNLADFLHLLVLPAAIPVVKGK